MDRVLGLPGKTAMAFMMSSESADAEEATVPRGLPHERRTQAGVAR